MFMAGLLHAKAKLLNVFVDLPPIIETESCEGM